MRNPIIRRGRRSHAAWVVLPLLMASCGGEGSTPSPAGPAPSATVLEVTASASGEDRDLNGYILTLDGSQSQPIGGVRNANRVTFEGLAAGSHELELSEATDNCQASGENPRTVTVTGGATTSTTFELTCTRVEKIAFARTVAGSGPELFVIQADGQDPFQITDDAIGLEEDFSWSWSPEGTQIAYVATGGAVIAVADADGFGSRLLTEPQSINPAWSPDGTSIAFQSNRTGEADVWIVNAGGGGETNLTADPATDDVAPDWAPDGSRISFGKFGTSGAIAIWTMAPNGSDKTAVIEETEFVAAGNPVWNPDGSRIAFLASEDGVTGEIWIVASDGSDLRQLTADAELVPANRQRWAPDGTRIAFHSERTGNLEIWVVDADGSNLTNLTDDPAADSDPAWSPDGSQILFASDRSGARAIWAIDSDGSNPRQLTDDAEADGDAAPAWRPPR